MTQYFSNCLKTGVQSYSLLHSEISVTIRCVVPITFCDHCSGINKLRIDLMKLSSYERIFQNTMEIKPSDRSLTVVSILAAEELILQHKIQQSLQGYSTHFNTNMRAAVPLPRNPTTARRWISPLPRHASVVTLSFGVISFVVGPQRGREGLEGEAHSRNAYEGHVSYIIQENAHLGLLLFVSSTRGSTVRCGPLIRLKDTCRRQHPGSYLRLE